MARLSHSQSVASGSQNSRDDSLPHMPSIEESSSDRLARGNGDDANRPEEGEEDYDGYETDDGMYFVNTADSTWSGTLLSEDDHDMGEALPMITYLALDRIRRKRYSWPSSSSSDESALGEYRGLQADQFEQRDIQQDKELSNAVLQIKFHVTRGKGIHIESISGGHKSTECFHPRCITKKNSSTTDYYAVLACHEEVQYCLICFEDLLLYWSMAEQPPTVNEPKPKTVLAMNLDGSADEIATDSDCSPSSSASTAMTSMITEDSSTISISEAHSWNKETIPTVPSKHCGPHQELIAPHDTRSRKQPMIAAGITHKSLELRRSGRLKSGELARMGATLPQVSSLARGIMLPKPKRMHASKIGVQAAKEDLRLQKLLKQRDEAIEKLHPGNKTFIQPTHAKAKSTKYCISKDTFGLVHTDLLSTPAKYWMQSGRFDLDFEEFGQPFDIRIKTTKAEQIKQTAKKSLAHPDRCSRSFSGLKNGGIMIKCSNQNCLTGWYHMECVNDNTVNEDEWLCEICESATSVSIALRPFSDLNKCMVEKLFAPAYSNPLLCHTIKTCTSGNDYEARTLSDRTTPSTPPAQLTQLDGVDDDFTEDAGSRSAKAYDPDFGKSAANISPAAPAEPPASSNFTCQGLSDTLEELSIPGAWPVTPKTSSSPTNVKSQLVELNAAAGPWSMLKETQRLAAYINPGKSLGQSQTFALVAWKLASEEQMNWQAKLARGRYHTGKDITMSTLHTAGGDLHEGDYASKASSKVFEHLETYEDRGVVLKNNCHGKNLSEVLIPLSD